MKRRIAFVSAILLALLSLCACAAPGGDSDASNLWDLEGNQLYDAAKYLHQNLSEYVGKTVKICGQYRRTPDMLHHMVEITATQSDSTQTVFFEFIHDPSAENPIEYPAPNLFIRIIGKVEQYVVGEEVKYRIVAESIYSEQD